MQKYAREGGVGEERLRNFSARLYKLGHWAIVVAITTWDESFCTNLWGPVVGRAPVYYSRQIELILLFVSLCGVGGDFRQLANCLI